MEFKYQVGQQVYTTKIIRGWFDYSIENQVPANTPCMIIELGTPEHSEQPYYLVRFIGKRSEFGTLYVYESSLKLG